MTAKYIAPLILIVFVENCFKHSTSSQSERIKIDINVNVEGNRLYFTAVNSFADQKNTESITEGIGLENVRTRLQILYPNSHELRISSGNNLYRVDLEIVLD